MLFNSEYTGWLIVRTRLVRKISRLRTQCAVNTSCIDLANSNICTCVMIDEIWTGGCISRQAVRHLATHEDRHTAQMLGARKLSRAHQLASIVEASLGMGDGVASDE